jgi:hypothetical protein
MNQRGRPSRTGITGSRKVTVSDLRSAAENTRTSALEKGQELYENYQEITNAATIWQRLTGADRRDAIDAAGEAADEVADKVFKKPVQKWFVKRNLPLITGSANHALDQLDTAFAQVGSQDNDSSVALRDSDYADIIPGVATLRKWDAKLNASYAKFKSVFSSDSE